MSSTQDARAPRRLAVWTDFGGVLTPPIAHTMGTFCTTQGIDPQALQQALGKVTARYGTSDIMEPIDTPSSPRRSGSRRSPRCSPPTTV